MTDMESFVKKVERMRNLQKQYFRTRDKAILLESISTEREVDEAIKEMKGESCK